MLVFQSFLYFVTCKVNTSLFTYLVTLVCAYEILFTYMYKENAITPLPKMSCIATLYTLNAH